jgi:hypothetical protein
LGEAMKVYSTVHPPALNRLLLLGNCDIVLAKSSIILGHQRNLATSGAIHLETIRNFHNNSVSDVFKCSAG